MKTYTEAQAKQKGGIYIADELAVLLNLRPYEDPEGGHCYYDDNYEYVEQTALGNYAYKRDLIYHGDYNLTSRSGVQVNIQSVTESPNFDPFMDEAFTESYRCWLRALSSTANRVFERICVMTEGVKRVGENGIYDSFELVPDWRKHTWKECCIFAFEEENGYNTITEFKNEYGTTDRSATIGFINKDGWSNWISDGDVEQKFNDYIQHYGG